MTDKKATTMSSTVTALDQKFSQPCKEMTDVGCYCYSALVAVALKKLFTDQEHNRAFAEKFITSLTSHLSQPTVVKDTMIALANEVEITDYVSFIETLKSEDVIKKHGAEIIVQDLVLLALVEGSYDARSRTIIKFIALILRVPWHCIEQYEDEVMEKFNEEAHESTKEEQEESDKAARNRKIKKYALLTTATIGGGVLLGVTGGLAAPFIAAGAGAIIGAGGAAALGSVAGVAIIGSLFGVAGAGLGAFKMKKRVGDIEEFAFDPLTQGSQLHLTIAVSGWLTKECCDFVIPWRGLAQSREQFSLRYESKYLKDLGTAMDYLVNIAISSATSEALKYTVLSGVMTAIFWPAAILSASSVIDNPWSVMTTRAQAVGRQLAEVLLSRQQGRRPVTLIGYSLGARVIYYCLLEMSKRKNSEGIVEDAVLLGAPVPSSLADWSQLQRVVAGRIVNGYCRGDWLLKFLYRTASVQMNVAGLAPVLWKDRRMHNVDLSDLIEGHMDYQHNLDAILEILGMPVKDHPKLTSTEGSLKEWVDINRAMRQSASSTKSNIPVSKTSDGLAVKAPEKPSVVGSQSDSNLHEHVMEESNGRESRRLDRQKSVDEAVVIAESILSEIIADVTGTCVTEHQRCSAERTVISHNLEELAHELQFKAV